MDEKMTNLWIDLVLIPWRNTRKPGVVPLLILDAYCIHMTGSIVNRIQNLGIEVQHIPGGCTWLCQPVDVGVNRPIKSEMSSGRSGYLMVTELSMVLQKSHSRNWLLSGSS
jgi:hypothetical protein